jgi:hypothetical protein
LERSHYKSLFEDDMLIDGERTDELKSKVSTSTQGGDSRSNAEGRSLQPSLYVSPSHKKTRIHISITANSNNRSKTMTMKSGLSYSCDTCPRVVRRLKSFAPPKAEEERTAKNNKNKNKKQRHHVTFHVDEQDRPIEHVYSYQQVPKELFSMLYWRNEEIQGRLEHERNLARSIAKSAPQLVKGLSLLHGLRQDEETQVAKFMLAASGCRGLEDCMMPCIIKHRRWAIQTILLIQGRSRSENPGADLEQIMHVWSKRVGEASCRFALHLAEIDEAEACWEEEAEGYCASKEYSTHTSRAPLSNLEQDTKIAPGA